MKNGLPQAVDVERQVLGAMLLDGDLAIPRVLEKLKPAHFYSDRNRKIFSAISALFERNEPVDNHTLLEELRRRKELDKVGGATYLAGLLAEVATSANLDYHAKIIIEKFMARRLIVLSQQAQSQARSFEEPGKIITWLANELLSLGAPQGGLVPLGEKAKEVLESWKSGGGQGVGTGFYALDKLFRGFKPGDFVVVAGATSMGKSAFVQNLAFNLARAGLPVAIFSLEMSSELWAERALNCLAGVDVKQAQEEDWPRLEEAVQELLSLQIWVDDDSNLDLTKLRAKALRRPETCFAIVDYLQLMAPPNGKQSREQELSALAQGFKNMARDLNLTVIAVSQFSRYVDRREDHRPRLSDLRGSGGIEQGADTVFLLYRPEYYGITELETTEEGRLDVRGKAEIIVGKQRRGPTGSVWLNWEAKWTRFEDPADAIPF